MANTNFDQVSNNAQQWSAHANVGHIESRQDVESSQGVPSLLHRIAPNKAGKSQCKISANHGKLSLRVQSGSKIDLNGTTISLPAGLTEAGFESPTLHIDYQFSNVSGDRGNFEQLDTHFSLQNGDQLYQFEPMQDASGGVTLTLVNPKESSEVFSPQLSSRCSKNKIHNMAHKELVTPTFVPKLLPRSQARSAPVAAVVNHPVNLPVNDSDSLPANDPIDAFANPQQDKPNVRGHSLPSEMAKLQAQNRRLTCTTTVNEAKEKLKIAVAKAFIPIKKLHGQQVHTINGLQHEIVSEFNKDVLGEKITQKSDFENRNGLKRIIREYLAPVVVFVCTAEAIKIGVGIAAAVGVIAGTASTIVGIPLAIAETAFLIIQGYRWISRKGKEKENSAEVTKQCKQLYSPGQLEPRHFNRLKSEKLNSAIEDWLTQKLDEKMTKLEKEFDKIHNSIMAVPGMVEGGDDYFDRLNAKYLALVNKIVADMTEPFTSGYRYLDQNFTLREIAFEEGKERGVGSTKNVSDKTRHAIKEDLSRRYWLHYLVKNATTASVTTTPAVTSGISTERLTIVSLEDNGCNQPIGKFFEANEDNMKSLTVTIPKRLVNEPTDAIVPYFSWLTDRVQGMFGHDVPNYEAIPDPVFEQLSKLFEIKLDTKDQNGNDIQCLDRENEKEAGVKLTLRLNMDNEAASELFSHFGNNSFGHLYDNHRLIAESLGGISSMLESDDVSVTESNPDKEASAEQEIDHYND